MDEYLSDDSGGDEVLEVKRALREASARKRLISRKLHEQEQRKQLDRCELESLLRSRTDELRRTQHQLAQRDFDLKESRYLINELQKKYSELSEDSKRLEIRTSESVGTLEAKLAQHQRTSESWKRVAMKDCDHLRNSLNAIYQSAFETRRSSSNESILPAPKTTRQLLDAAATNLNKLRKTILSAASDVGNIRIDQEESVIQSESFNDLFPSLQDAATSDTDRALLDMCRTLEDENKALMESVEAMRQQLAEANRTESAHKLIPHYRLAIVRSRAYTANLLEQIKREQATSQSLRDQLDATYSDLKKVVEEKRRLYTRLSQQNLEADERTCFAIDRREAEIDLAGGDAGAGRRGGERAQTRASSVRSGTSPGCNSVHNEQPDYQESRKSASTKYNTDAAAAKAKDAAAVEFRGSEGATSHSHLQTELQCLDYEIEQLKGKLSQVAMFKTQQILQRILEPYSTDQCPHE